MEDEVVVVDDEVVDDKEVTHHLHREMNELTEENQMQEINAKRVYLRR